MIKTKPGLKAKNNIKKSEIINFDIINFNFSQFGKTKLNIKSQPKLKGRSLKQNLFNLNRNKRKRKQSRKKPPRLRKADLSKLVY